MIYKKTFAILAALGVICSADAAQNILGVSVGDLHAVGRGAARLNTEENVRSALSFWVKHYKLDIINWRHVDVHDDYFVTSKAGYMGWADRQVKAMRANFNDNDVARKICKELGVKFYINLTFNDGGWPQRPEGCKVYYCMQDKALIANPELQEVDKRGFYHWGYLDLSNPQARKLWVDRIVEQMEKLQADGLYLNTRSHSGCYSQDRKYKDGPHHADRFGFGKNLVAEYKKRYGIDIMTDPRFDYKSPQFAPNSVEVENWRKLRGEYFVIFYKEVKAALNGKGFILSLPLGNYMGSSGGNIYVDHEKIISERIADTLSLGVSSGYVPIKKQRELGYLSSELREANYNVPTFAEYIKKYGSLAEKNQIRLVDNSVIPPYSKELQKQVDNTAHHGGLTIGSPNISPLIAVSDSPELRPGKGTFTVEALVYNYPESRPGRIMSKYNHTQKPANSGRGWELMCSWDELELAKSKNKNKILRAIFRCNLVHKFKGRKVHKDIHVYSTEVIRHNEWVHVAATLDMDKDEIRLYVNGKLSQTEKIPPDAVLNNNYRNELIIGGYGGSRSNAFTGLIDYLRISSKPFAAAGKIPFYSGKEAGTVLFFDFENRINPAVKPASSQIECIGMESYKAGFQGKNVALYYPEGVLYNSGTIKQPTRD